MNESSDHQEEEITASRLSSNKAGGQSPGEILREGRKAHDYSVEDLCAQTKLSPKSVRALEDNDFAALSQPVFARGYYRQCAKVLDIDSDRLMAAYTAWAGEPAPQTVPSSTAVGVVPEDVTPKDWRIFGLIAAAAGVILLAIIGIFALGSGGTESADDADNAVSTDFTAAGQSGATSNSDSGDSGVTGRLAEGRRRDSGGGGGAGAPAAAGNSSSPRRPGGRNVNDTLGIEPPGANGGEQEPAEPSIPPNRLKLTFTGRSWVDVRDANGARLLTGIYEQGQEREFNGEPPYKITLGFAPGVKMSIGGESVDVAAQTTSGQTARMTVEARDDN